MRPTAAGRCLPLTHALTFTHIVQARCLRPAARCSGALSRRRHLQARSTRGASLARRATSTTQVRVLVHVCLCVCGGGVGLKCIHRHQAGTLAEIAAVCKHRLLPAFAGSGDVGNYTSRTHPSPRLYHLAGRHGAGDVQPSGGRVPGVPRVRLWVARGRLRQVVCVCMCVLFSLVVRLCTQAFTLCDLGRAR